MQSACPRAHPLDPLSLLSPPFTLLPFAAGSSPAVESPTVESSAVESATVESPTVESPTVESPTVESSHRNLEWRQSSLSPDWVARAFEIVISTRMPSATTSPADTSPAAARGVFPLSTTRATYVSATMPDLGTSSPNQKASTSPAPTRSPSRSAIEPFGRLVQRSRLELRICRCDLPTRSVHVAVSSSGRRAAYAPNWNVKYSPRMASPRKMEPLAGFAPAMYLDWEAIREPLRKAVIRAHSGGKQRTRRAAVHA